MLQDAAAAAQTVATHSGELGPEIQALIAGAATVIAKFIQEAFKPKAMAWVSILVSLVTLGLWTVSYYAFSREGVFPLFCAYGITLTTVHGALKALEHPAAAGALSSMTGGRAGTPKE